MQIGSKNSGELSFRVIAQSILVGVFFKRLVSDYQGFASESPDKLAKAIETGIPNTLRGMMWQLM
jgi:hypothetical protein